MIGSTNVETLKEWLSSNDAVLVDVREQAEWDAGHLAGATLLPLATVSAASLPSASGKKLVIYCRSGRRSQTACEIVYSQNPRLDVYNLEGGILAWDGEVQK